MSKDKRRLLIYEALELRSEYDARVKTLRSCLPETRRSDHVAFLSRFDDGAWRPAEGVEPGALREELRTLEHKRHKLNVAIQGANFANTIAVGENKVSLTEALELRKRAKERVDELRAQLPRSTAVRVIHKEDRDIEEEPEVPFVEVRSRLEEARLEFRRLNRALRKASFTVEVEFLDEESS